MKRKKFIFIVIIAIFLISLLYNFFVVKPVYIAKGVLFVNPRDSQNRIMSSEDLSNPMVYLSPISVATYKEMILSSEMIKDGVSKEVRNFFPNMSELQVQQFIKKILQIDNLAGTTLLEIKVSYKDPKIAKAVSDSIINNSVSYINGVITKQNEEILAKLNDSLKEAKINLDKAQGELTKFESSNDLDLFLEERDQLLTSYGDIVSKISEKELLLNTLISTAEIKKEIRNLQSQKEQIKKEIDALNKSTSEEEQTKYYLERDLEMKNANFEMVLKSYSNFSMNDVVFLPIVVSESPTLPSTPETANRLVKTIMLTLSGTVLVLFLIILLELFKKEKA